MIRNFSISLALACMIAVPAQARENQGPGIGFSPKANMAKRTFAAGWASIDVYASSRVDVESLVADIDFAKSLSPQAISDRFNERRMRLYPDEEIVLSIGPAQEARVPDVPEKASLVRAIYWWNNTNCSDCYWYAEYKSATATLFVGRVQYGGYNIYDKVGTGNYIFRYLVDTDESATRYTVGAKTARGFRGYADGIASRTDVVLYFFN